MPLSVHLPPLPTPIGPGLCRVRPPGPVSGRPEATAQPSSCRYKSVIDTATGGATKDLGDTGGRAGGVIWISGYSASGKTTVGRKVEGRRHRLGREVVFLDGDDLRSILAGRWGHGRDERIHLARVDFRLASPIAAQGFAVVVCAVAMDDEVRAWLRENVPDSLQVHLDVPADERLRRDRATKGVYETIGDTAALHDLPGPDALRIVNHGDSPDAAADRIVAAWLGARPRGADYGRTRHWSAYYAAHHAPVEPSPFARAVAACLDPGTRLLEVGCGNGRDAGFFAREGHDVTAIDMSEAAIEACSARVPDVAFVAGTLPVAAAGTGGDFAAVYSRFVIHAMPLAEEEALLDSLPALMRPGGRLFVECRSINDPLAREGEVISPTERLHGHYRRFIVPDEFRSRLAARGFEIVRQIESNGLARHGDEDPVVLRVTARLPSR